MTSDDNELDNPRRVIVLEMEYFFDEPIPENLPIVPVIPATKANLKRLLAEPAAKKAQEIADSHPPSESASKDSPSPAP